MIRAVAHSEYQTDYPDSIPFRSGESVILGERETDHPGWVGWIKCTGQDGQEAWVHASFLIMGETDAILTRAYDARELTVRPGDHLTILEAVGGFALCSDARGETGWVPVNRLDLDDRAPDRRGNPGRRVPIDTYQYDTIFPSGTHAPREWHVPLRGANNVRDLGGYFGKHGKRIRPGLLYRADSIAKLTRSDLADLAERGIRTIVDFRESFEADRDPDRLPKGATRHWIPIKVGGREIRDEVGRVIRGRSVKDTAELLVDVGEAFVTTHASAFARWFRILLDEKEATPHLFHCSAGKDRTGFAAAMLLMALEVPAESVMYDYLASNRWLDGFVRSTMTKIRLVTLSRRKAEAARPLLVADERYFMASLNIMIRKYGNFASFARICLNLSDEDLLVLQRRYLE